MSDNTITLRDKNNCENENVVEAMSDENCKKGSDEEDEVEPDWEQKYIITEKIKDEMESMWEIPQIFHFLQLTKKTLNISHLSMYEMERMLLMPRASKQLANIMTCLLSSPSLKSKLHKLPPMPYEFWTNVLMHKVRTWFKIYQNKHKNIIKVFESIGVDSDFWNIFPDVSCVEGKDFESLTFKERIWLLKTLCDTILHNRRTVQEELSKQSWENKIETILGIDRHGARYIYFPQFLKNDLRVYRHCLDNRILSAVKAPIIKEEPEWEVKEEDVVKTSRPGRNKRRKSRWRNGSLPYKGKRRKDREKKRRIEKLINSSVNDEIANNLLTTESEDLNKMNSSNENNNLTFDSMTDSIPEGMSQVNQENLNEAESNVASEIHKEFEGHSAEEFDNMSIIYNILDELISNIEKDLSGLEEGDFEIVREESSVINDTKYTVYLTKISQNSNIAENMSDRESPSPLLPLDVVLESEDINNSGKEATSQELKLGVKEDNEMDDTLSTNDQGESKPDTFSNKDESNLNLKRNKSTILDKDLENDEIGLDKWLDALSKKRDSQENIESGHKYKGLKKDKKEKDGKKNIDEKEENDGLSTIESDYQSSLIEIRDTLINEASFDDLPHISKIIDDKYNFENVKLTENEAWETAADDFKGLITDLSTSDFKLIADSVETLRNFIDHFSCKDGTLSNIKSDSFIPVCEINLLSKLSDLLHSVESFESALKDCTEKSRSKLQKEWIDLKKGMVEGKEPTEDSQASKWWVIGSQNCMLSSCGSLTEHSDCEYGKRSEHHRQKCKSNEEEENKRKDNEESEDGDNESEEMQEQTKRVLRARGISSYTEQLLSDNSETEDLERWTEFEATYTAPDAQTNSSTLLPHSQLERSDKRSDPDDSDQEWILPGSRKKRNKRQSASRRLKSFQHKLQNIKANSSSPTRAISSEVPEEKPSPSALKESEEKDESKVNVAAKATPSVKETIKTKPTESLIKVVPSAKMTCKIECADSVHSELDIKDEGPIIDPVVSNYNINVQQPQGYVIVKTEPTTTANYYVMQQNPSIPSVVPQPYMQQTAYNPNALPQSHVHSTPAGYYVQNTPNYVVHGPHSAYGPPRHPMTLTPHQQMLVQQNSQVMGPHQVMNQPNYVQYMVNNQQQNVISNQQQNLVNSQQQNMMNSQQHNMMNSQQQIRMNSQQQNVINNQQQNVINSSLPHPRMMNSNSHRLSYVNSQPRGPVMNQQIRMGLRGQAIRLRQNLTHPNGAVIRSMPIAGNGTRFAGNRAVVPRNFAPRGSLRAGAPRLQRLTRPSAVNSTISAPSTTSLIVLSDSDDDIEMIIEKPNSDAKPGASSPRKTIQTSPRKKPVVTSEVTVSNPKSSLPPQIVQRMSQGGISITPVKANPPPSNTNTQLVVVVNETGSHYALALPNGSKLILTPDQVAQIRASNGGKLIL